MTSLLDFKNDVAVLIVDPNLKLNIRVNVNACSDDADAIFYLANNYQSFLEKVAETLGQNLKPIFSVLREQLPEAYKAIFKATKTMGTSREYDVYLGRAEHLSDSALGYTDLTDTARLYVAPPDSYFLYTPDKPNSFNHTVLHEIIHNLMPIWGGSSKEYAHEKAYVEGLAEYVPYALYTITANMGAGRPDVSSDYYTRMATRVAKWSGYKTYFDYFQRWDRYYPFWGLELWLHGVSGLEVMKDVARKNRLMREPIGDVSISVRRSQEGGGYEFYESRAGQYIVIAYGMEMAWDDDDVVSRLGKPLLGNMRERMKQMKARNEERAKINEKADMVIQNFEANFYSLQAKMKTGRKHLKNETTPTVHFFHDFQREISDMQKAVARMEKFTDFYSLHRYYRAEKTFATMPKAHAERHIDALVEKLPYLVEVMNGAFNKFKTSMIIRVEEDVAKVKSDFEVITQGDVSGTPVNNYAPLDASMAEVTQVQTETMGARAKSKSALYSLQVTVADQKMPIIEGLYHVYANGLAKIMSVEKLAKKLEVKDSDNMKAWENGDIITAVAHAYNVINNQSEIGENDLNDGIEALMNLGVVVQGREATSGFMNNDIYVELMTLFSKAKALLVKRLRGEDWVGYDLMAIQRMENASIPDMMASFGKRLMELYNIIPPTQKRTRTVRAGSEIRGSVNISETIQALLKNEPSFEEIRCDVIEPAIRDIHVAILDDLSISKRSAVRVGKISLTRVTQSMLVSGSIASSIFEDAKSLYYVPFAERAEVYELGSLGEFLRLQADLISMDKHNAWGSRADYYSSSYIKRIGKAMGEKFETLKGNGTRLDLALDKLVNSGFMFKEGTKIVIILSDGSPTQGSGQDAESMEEDVTIQQECISLMTKYGDELNFFYIYLYPVEQEYAERGRPKELLDTKAWQNTLKGRGVQYAEVSLMEVTDREEIGMENFTVLFGRIYQGLEEMLQRAIAE